MVDFGDSVNAQKKLSDISNPTPGALTNYFATAVTMPVNTTRLTVTINLNGASTFGYILNGAATLLLFNSGVALAANSTYTFTLGARQGDTYNFQHGSNVTIQDFKLEAVYGGL